MAMLMLAGVILLVLGVRGRRINDHPVCGKCRFDLFGNPKATGCPECGADLTANKATRIGVREKRRGMIVAAVLLLLIGVGGGGALGYFTNQDTDWQPYKPVWWLTFEANLSPGKTSDAALNELLKRVNSGDLNDAQMETLIADALANQVDLSRTWQPTWGDFVEKHQADGKLDEELWKQYALNALDSRVKLMVRPKIRIGDPVPYRWTNTGARVGTKCTLIVRSHGAMMQVESIQIKSSIGGGSRLSNSSSGSSSSSSTLKPEEVAKLKPGAQKITHTVNYKVYPNWEASRDDENAVLAEKTITLEAETEFANLNEPTARLIHDPQYEQAVRDTVKLRGVKFQKPSDNSYYAKKNQREVEVRVAFSPRPLDAAFEVIILHNDKEYKLSSISSPASGQTNWHTHGGVPEHLVGQTVDLILRPSLDVAVRTVDCFDIWGEEIIFPDVLLEEKK